METLAEAREYVAERLSKGVICPCCERYSKKYQRTLNSSMAKALQTCWGQAGTEPFHAPTLVAEGRWLAGLRYWGLIEKSKGRGMWRITAKGTAFLNGEEKVPRWAVVASGQRFLRFVGPEDWSIDDALATRYDHDEVMAEVKE